MADKKLIIFAALPFVLVAAAVFGARAVDFEQLVFSPVQRRVLHFTPEKIEVRLVDGVRKAASRAMAAPSSMAGFFRPGAAPSGQGRTAGRPDSSDPLGMSVSFIMLGRAGESRAIVNDELVIEGDTVGGMLVKRIEEDKVLLKGKETRWVYMEALR